MCPIVVVQMALIWYLQQWYIDPCGKTHMGCMWDPFGSLWATHKGYMVLNARKPVFGGLPTTKAQTSQHFCFV